MRFGQHTTHASYEHVHGTGQNVDKFALERFDFSGDKNVYGDRQVEFDMADDATRGERMLGVCAVIEARERAQQAETSDGAPADKFDVAVGGICVGGN